MFVLRWRRKADRQSAARRHRRPGDAGDGRARGLLGLEALEGRTLLSFAAPANYDTGSIGAVALAVGDFNGDGVPDLAATHLTDPGSVGVLLGNGDGSFRPPRTTYPTGRNASSVAAADLRGDGKLDLVLASRGFALVNDFGSVSVFFGDGDGTFRAGGTYYPGYEPTAVVVADFNGDGIPDLAVANSNAFNRGSPSVSVLLGQGDGTFRQLADYDVGPHPISLAVGDFNGDGRPDLAVVATDHTVGVLLGNGDGSFQAVRDYEAGGGPADVAVADFNGDGRPDLAVAGGGGGGAVSVLLGNGDGSFQAPTSSGVRRNPGSLAVGDFNGDGRPDLVAASVTDNTVSVLLGNGDGSFQTAVNYPAGVVDFVAAGAFRGAGVLDLAVGGYGVSVLLGNGDGTFQAVPSYAVGSRPYAVAVGDFNGDGIPDLVTASVFPRHELDVLLGNGDGTFQPAVPYDAGPAPYAVAVGDFNGDGRLDLAVANMVGPMDVLLGNGDGTFQQAVPYDAGPNLFAVAVGDFNGDGKPDLVAVNNLGLTGGVSVLLGNGDGSFQRPVPYRTGEFPTSVAVGDFNGDGIPDLAVTNSDIGAGRSPSLSVLLGNGDGTFQPAQNSLVGLRPEFVAVGDFNGDGVPDLAVANAAFAGTPENVTLLLGNGDGTFRTAGRFDRIFGPLVVGDFNNPGFPRWLGRFGMAFAPCPWKTQRF
jgi:hypothetical protein